MKPVFSKILFQHSLVLKIVTFLIFSVLVSHSNIDFLTERR